MTDNEKFETTLADLLQQAGAAEEMAVVTLADARLFFDEIKQRECVRAAQLFLEQKMSETETRKIVASLALFEAAVESWQRYIKAVGSLGGAQIEKAKQH